MAIPSKESFEDYLKAVKWDREKIHHDCDFGINLDCSIEKYAETYLRQYFILRDDYIKNSYKFSVAEHFNNCPCMKGAKKSIFYRRANIEDKDEFVASWVKLILTSDYDLEDTKNRLRRFVSHDPLAIFSGIIESFYNYYYTNKWENILNQSLIAGDLLESIVLIIDELEKMDVLKEFIFIGSGTRNVFKGSISKTLSEHRNYIYPIKRNDSTLKERGLVYDLAKNFKRGIGSNKTNAIFHLLMREGVKNPIELRTIENMIKVWKDNTIKMN